MCGCLPFTALSSFSKPDSTGHSELTQNCSSASVASLFNSQKRERKRRDEYLAQEAQKPFKIIPKRPISKAKGFKNHLFHQQEIQPSKTTRFTRKEVSSPAMRQVPKSVFKNQRLLAEETNKKTEQKKTQQIKTKKMELSMKIQSKKNLANKL